MSDNPSAHILKPFENNSIGEIPIEMLLHSPEKKLWRNNLLVVTFKRANEKMEIKKLKHSKCSCFSEFCAHFHDDVLVTIMK